MNKIVKALTILTVLAIVIPAFLSNTNGPSTDASGSPVSSFGTQGCRGCHSSGGSFNPLTGITVAGLPTSYYPGTTYTLTLSINSPTNKNGFQLAALTSMNMQAGSWTTGTGSKTITQGGRTYIEHNSGSSSGSWTFDWTAPATNVGTVSFYSSANASNNNSSTSGDNIYTFTTTATGINAISATENITNASCATVADGAIQMNISGGVPGYTSLWSTGASFNTSTYTLNGLSAGNYTVTITDVDGNSEVENYTVDANNPFTINATVNGALCVPQDGAISTSISGGQMPLTYAWSNGATTANLTQLAAGNYALTVTDAAGCVSDTSFQVADLGSGMQASWQVSDANCGAADGAITNLSINTTGALNILWSNGATSLDISGLSAGAYTVTITDANGCTESFSEIVNNLGAPTVSVTSTQNIACFDDNTGAIEVTASGGTGTKQYAWTGPNGFTSTDSALTGLIAGDYIYVVTDDNACITSDTVSLTQPAEPLQITVDSTLQPTDGNCNGYIEVSISGDNSSSGYQLSWTGPTSSTSEVVSNACSGRYELVVTDALGCFDTLSIELTDATGLADLNKEVWLVYPNPVTDQLTIQLPENSGTLYFRLYDLSGRVVLENQLNSNQSSIDVSALQSGQYLLQGRLPSGRVMNQIINKQ